MNSDKTLVRGAAVLPTEGELREQQVAQLRKARFAPAAFAAMVRGQARRQAKVK